MLDFNIVNECTKTICSVLEKKLTFYASFQKTDVVWWKYNDDRLPKTDVEMIKYYDGRYT